MENHPLHPVTPIYFRQPTPADGAAIFELVKACPPLDLNSRYLYFLLADHFAASCMLAEQDGKVVGFVSSYFPPNQADALFIWQVAVHPHAQGQGIAVRLLESLVARQSPGRIKRLLTTISPSNQASQALFKSFAKRHAFDIATCPYLQAEDFGSEGHEAEILYTLTPAT
ncbi:diaminobutyrate acetyltransferase [Thiomicrorhabdus cannonii]|uniref:diaminobutyrate acetyltransferase n=1 Tax=Thiomicrorhabdus cannonii TaxID=2748011 RepID=UPI0015B7AB8A|nr:diaminobutyrate acetyltransferase [Thiomicrorhabdus cannonii]